MYKKIVALFCVFSILSLISVPASADLSDAFEYTFTTFFEYLDYCGHIVGNDEFRISEWWKALTNAEDPEAAYETQISELPATGLTSSGALIWHSTWDDYYALKDDTTEYFYLSNASSESAYLRGKDTDRLSHIDDFTLYYQSDWSGYLSIGSNYLKAPVDGYYSIVPNTLIGSVSYCASDGTPGSISLYSDSDYLSRAFHIAGEYFQLRCRYITPLPSNSTDVYSYIFTYYFLIEPSDSNLISGVYNIDSRPTSITGNYGIIGDNGQITKVENTTIVNETNNTYTNPSTGTTSAITEWTYDYSDRSYNVTLESGDTVTVTYGDENITIQEGDTVYNVYYIVESSGEDPDVQPSPTPTPETCPHSYTSTVDREATCTFAGQITYTCSLCGHSYIESIPATGHAWDIKETVQTSYDEDGNLLQQGYTIYKCSVCGEEYKDETGTGPPGSGSGSGSGEEGESIWDKLGNLIGSVLGGIIGVIEAVLGAILDALTSLAAMIGEKLAAVVDLVLSMFTEIPALFTGFLGFLTAVFPFLPEDIMLLLTFGIAVVVFIGIIKALRR